MLFSVNGAAVHYHGLKKIVLGNIPVSHFLLSTSRYFGINCIRVGFSRLSIKRNINTDNLHDGMLSGDEEKYYLFTLVPAHSEAIPHQLIIQLEKGKHKNACTSK